MRVAQVGSVLAIVCLSTVALDRSHASQSETCDPNANPPNPPLTEALGCLDPPTLPSPLSTTTCEQLSNETLGTCYQFDVIGCPSVRGSNYRLRTISVKLKIVEPTPGVLERGTILLLGGLGGTGAWELASTIPSAPVTANTASRDVIVALQDLGFRTVQVVWAHSWWDVDDTTSLQSATNVEQEGLVRTSCRSASLLQWVYKFYVDCATCSAGLAFCATGNSAGSSQIAYALSKHGLGSGSNPTVDHAVFSSGPVFADLYEGCQPNFADPAQADDYRYLPNSKSLLDLAFGEVGGSGPCSDISYSPSKSCDPSPCNTDTEVLLDASSNVHSDGTFLYDHTKITTLTAPECANATTCNSGTSTVTEGDEKPGSLASAIAFWEFMDSLDPPVSLFPDRVTISGQEHSLPARPGGAKAIRDSLILDCYARP